MACRVGQLARVWKAACGPGCSKVPRFHGLRSISRSTEAHLVKKVWFRDCLTLGYEVIRLTKLSKTCRAQLQPRRPRHSVCQLDRSTQGKGVQADWTQDADSVTVGLVLTEPTEAKAIDLTVHPKRMKLSMNNLIALEGEFPDRVDPDGSFFTIEEKHGERTCIITLEKKQAGPMNWSEFFAEEAADTSITHQV